MFTNKFSQEDAPLFENFLNYSRQGIGAFHMPGHRGGWGCEPLFRELGGELLHLDLTELRGANLDQDPDFLLKKAEELAAEAFGAQRTYFLVNGASVGIMVAFLSLKNSAPEVLVARDCHLSVINGLILSGLKPIFLSPVWVEGLPCLPSVEEIENALNEYPGAAGVFLTNPGYHGIYGPLKKIAALCHRKKIPLLLDEAHGGHLKYINPDAEEGSTVGADLWVWGTHKMMGSLTQTGMLHLGSNFQYLNAVEEALELLNSTSPSYILLSSLDSTRRQLYFKGQKMFTRAAELGEEVRNKIRDLQGLKLLDNRFLPAGYGIDPTKIVLSFTPAGWSGIKAEEVLRKKFHVQPEYADRDYLYFFISYVQEKKEIAVLIQALSLLAAESGPDQSKREVIPPPWKIKSLQLSPREAADRLATYLPLHEAVGEIASGWVAAYPPGIPLWVPGEEITIEMCEWITSFLRMGGYVRGIKEGKVKIVED